MHHLCEIAHIADLKGILKKGSPGGGHFDYQWGAENLIRSAAYSGELHIKIGEIK